MPTASIHVAAARGRLRVQRVLLSPTTDEFHNIPLSGPATEDHTVHQHKMPRTDTSTDREKMRGCRDGAGQGVEWEGLLMDIGFLLG